VKFAWVLGVILPGLVCAQLDKPGEREIQDDPSLPMVLLIGDSIAYDYTPVVRERLKGRANVHFVHRKVERDDTVNALEEIDTWLASGHWDIIHFNWGLWDLKVQDDGRNVVPIEVYGKNLRELVRRMKGTQAQLIFATTTPVPEYVLSTKRRAADAPVYNSVALRIMEEEKIHIDDLNALISPRLVELQWPNDVHFGLEGDQVLGERVATCVTYLLRSVKPKR
jgi:hypothetical protein